MLDQKLRLFYAFLLGWILCGAIFMLGGFVGWVVL
jgi:hypothetical protein